MVLVTVFAINLIWIKSRTVAVELSNLLVAGGTDQVKNSYSLVIVQGAAILNLAVPFHMVHTHTASQQKCSIQATLGVRKWIRVTLCLWPLILVLKISVACLVVRPEQRVVISLILVGWCVLCVLLALATL